MISPTASLLYFIVLTTVYFGLKYTIVEKHGSNNKGFGIALTISYLAIMLIVQLGVNISNAKEKCGTIQLMPSVIYTVIPNLFIFGGLLMALMFFPGWKAPFSNTIGYVIATLMNIKTTFNNILVSDSNNKLLKMVYRDPSLMINEITPENFDIFLSKMNGAKYSILSQDYKKYVPDLYNLVVIKDKIAEFLWYILTGFLVISNSHSYIMSIKCKRTATELEAKLGSVMEKQSKKKKKAEKYAIGY